MFYINYKRYIYKNTRNNLKYLKYRLKRTLKLRFKENNLFFCRTRVIYLPVYWKINIGFYPTVPYNAYQGQFWWIRRKFINFKYHAIIAIIKEINAKMRSRSRRNFNRTVKKKTRVLHDFLYLYNYFFYSIYTDLFYLMKFIKSRRQRVRHFLILTFTANRLFVNLQNLARKNYLFLSTGLFIKFFEKKKSLKKTKTIKLLIGKFLRKIFFISKIKNATLIIKKNPLFLLEILNIFNVPIVHKFFDPVSKCITEEESSNYPWFKFLYFVFLDNKDFSNNKKKKRGRIKRKILRKLILENKIID